MVVYRGNNEYTRCDSEKAIEKFQGMTIYDTPSLTWRTKVELENSKYLVPMRLLVEGKLLLECTSPTFTYY